jgi:hypothetical protein
MNSSPDSAPEPTQTPQGLLGTIAHAFANARHVVVTLFELVTLEARRAGLTLLWLVTLAVIAAILFVTAWLGFMIALTLWIVSLGITWAGAVAIVAAVNLLAALAAILVGIALSRNLLFPGTRRQLGG